MKSSSDDKYKRPYNAILGSQKGESLYKKIMKECEKSFNDMEDSVQDIISWKDNVTKALWIMFTGIVGLILKTLIMGS